MKLGHLIEYNMRNVFYQKLCGKWGRETSFGNWWHCHILQKLGAGLGRVFSAIWGEWVSALCQCDQSPLDTQLGVETQSLHVTFGPKIDSPNARWVTSGEWDCFPNNGQKLVTEQPNNR